MKINKFRFFIKMLFLTLLLDATFLDFITIEEISIVTLQIPTVISSVVLGPLYGVIMGFIFGLLSFLRSVSSEATAIDLLFTNPMISILPGMCIGIISGYGYIFLNKLFKARFRLISIMISTMLGSLANTILLLCALYLTNADKLIKIFKLSNKNGLQIILLNIATFNGLIGGLISALISTIIVFWVFRRFDKIDDKSL